MKILFTTWEGGGHVQPMMLAAAGMIARGHEALLISDAVNADESAKLGVPFQAWKTAPSRTDKAPSSDPLKDWTADSPLEIIEGLCRAIISGPAKAYAADVTATLGLFNPDVIVSQELMFGVMAAAEAARKPLALFVANVWSLPTLEGAPPFGAGLPPATDDDERAMFSMITNATREAFQMGLEDLNAARESLGLRPLADLFDQLNAADRILLATSNAFDYGATDLPPAFTYVGPYVADPIWTAPFEYPWPASNTDPLILVSFSSMYQAQEGVLRQVIAALSDLPVRALVTLGPVLDPADFPAPPHIAVVRSAPHGELLPETSLFITHAGHGSTLRPLMAGVPLLCLPLGRDQPDNAARAAAAGAALRLEPDAPANEIREAIQTLLGEPAYAVAARSLGSQISDEAAARHAETEIEALAR